MLSPEGLLQARLLHGAIPQLFELLWRARHDVLVPPVAALGNYDDECEGLEVDQCGLVEVSGLGRLQPLSWMKHRADDRLSSDDRRVELAPLQAEKFSWPEVEVEADHDGDPEVEAPPCLKSESGHDDGEHLHHHLWQREPLPLELDVRCRPTLPRSVEAASAVLGTAL